MTSFTIIEHAVKMGLITYKDIVEQLCETNKELADELFKQVSPAEDDPKVLRKVHKAAQVAKFGEDKEAIKAAMKAYDASLKPPKPKRAPPVRVWTAEDKVRTKAKNAYVKSKEREYGDDVTVADIKVLRKKWRKEYDGEHKAPKAEPEDEAEAEAAEDEAAEDEAAEDEAAEDEAAEDEAAEDAVEPAVVEAAVVVQVGLSDAEKKEWSALKKKDRDGTITDVETARYKELKKKK